MLDNWMSNSVTDCRGAIFDPSADHFRYVLWRRWGFASDHDPRFCAFIGLNPSTADAQKDDPTIRRCIRFCKDWGFDGYIMLNAYAFRATKPSDMRACRRSPGEPSLCSDPTGPLNDFYIYHFAAICERVIVAWGNNIDTERESQVLNLIKDRAMALRVTKQGHPQHPLYVPASTKPIPFRRNQACDLSDI